MNRITAEVHSMPSTHTVLGPDE